MNKVNSKKRTQQQFNAVKKILGAVGLSLLSFLYLQFGIGAAGIGIWLQAIPVFIASLYLVVGAYRILRNKRASVVVFWGTLPAWLVHIPITVIIEDESPIFVIATSITPIVAGIVLLLHRKK
jgi:hypothetical protein